MSAKRIGILTGGGDVPGLNSVIKSVVYRGAEIGCEVLGIRRGWEGLTQDRSDSSNPTDLHVRSGVSCRPSEHVRLGDGPGRLEYAVLS